ncbi:dual 3',5'-cyclic-AMP and -GMP phosphodiesterase 11A, partial [Trichonephila clavata]
DIRCNIFCDLGTNDYKQVLDEIKYTILATNLQKYQLQCERMRHIVETGVDFRKKHVRNCLKALMMMACDLCAGWKSWDEHKNVIWSLYKEYFNQGDKELSFGIITPDHMLRTNAENIPKYQTAFMENVVLPIYQLLTKVFPQLREILKTAQENLDCWKTY